jgi:hypothetical protein
MSASPAEITGSSLTSFEIKPDRSGYVKAGYNPNVDHILVELNQLGEPDRALLADYIGDKYTHTHDNPHATDFYRDGRYLVQVAAPTAEALLDALKANEASAQAKNDARQAKRAEILDAAREVIAQRKTREIPRQNLIYAAGHGYSAQAEWADLAPDWPEGVGLSGSLVLYEDVETGEDYEQWLQDLDTENGRRYHDARVAAWKQIEDDKTIAAQKKAERQRGVDALRRLASIAASHRVQLLIEEQHKDWLPLAEDEYLTAHTPAGFGDPLLWCGETECAAGAFFEELDLVKPFERDILALREARQLVDIWNDSELPERSVLSDPQMAFVKICRPATLSDWTLADKIIKSTGGGSGVIKIAEHRATRLTVTAPTGAQRHVFRINDPDKAATAPAADCQLTGQIRDAMVVVAEWLLDYHGYGVPFEMITNEDTGTGYILTAGRVG